MKHSMMTRVSRRACAVRKGVLLIPSFFTVQPSSSTGRFFIITAITACSVSLPAHAFISSNDASQSAAEMIRAGVSPERADSTSLIVKFNDTMTVSASQAFAVSGNYAGYLAGQTTSVRTSLDTLFSTYGVTEVKALVTPPPHINNLYGGGNPSYVQSRAEIRTAWQAYMTEIAERYPRRFARSYGDVPLPDFSHVYVVRFANPQDINAVTERFLRDSHVEYAHPNYIYRAQALPNDRFIDPDQNGTWSIGAWGQAYEDAWNLKMIGADRAWDITKGASTTLAVIDTGVDYAHPDLDAQIWSNRGEISGNGIDDDDNGFIDDVRGWNFADISNDPMDTGDHGTAVAALAAGEHNNQEGVAGVAPDARVMPLKVLGGRGGGTSDHVAQAIIYAAANGADVMNLSLGGGESLIRSVVEDAVQLAYAQGVVVVAAAGNDASSNKYFSPASSLYSITVSAVDQNNAPTFFTSYGSSIDVAAPGGGVDTLPQSFGAYRNVISADGSIGENVGMPVAEGYLRAAGTSFSAPHVAGQVALILSYRPELTVEQVRQLLRKGALPSGTPGWDKFTGYGRINLDNTLAVNTPATVRIDMRHDADVVGQVQVTASAHAASQLRPLAGWGAWYAPETSLNQKTHIGSGSIPSTGKIQFSFDASVLPVGTYVLIVEVSESSGASSEDIRRFHRREYVNESIGRMPLPTGFGSALAVADVDGDGDVDMFSGDVLGIDADVLNPTNHLYLNDGSGLFTSADTQLPLNHNTAGFMLSAQFADIDRDGDQDILSTALKIPGDSELYIWLNNGLGFFSDVSASRFPQRYTHPTQITEQLYVADLNGDRAPDIIASGIDQVVTIIMNNGSGVFTDTTATAGVGWTEDAIEVEFSDIDHDGDMDMFVGCMGCPGVKYGMNTGTGSFVHTTSQLFAAALSFELIDVNADGWDDLVIEKSLGRFYLYLNTRNGGFVVQNIGNPIIQNEDLAEFGLYEADIDGNGYPDIYGATTPSTRFAAHGVLLNNKLGTFIDRSTYYLSDDPMSTNTMIFRDVSGDAFPDIITGHFFARPQIRVARWDDFHYGDFDLNGSISTTEALRVLRYAVGIAVPTPAEYDRADVDFDDSVTPTDVLCMLKASVGKMTLPCRPTETSSFIYEQNTPDGVVVTSTRRTDLGKLLNLAQENGISLAELGTTTLGDLGITGKERLQFTATEGYHIALIRGCDRLRRNKCDILIDGDEHIRVEVVETPTTPLITLWNAEIKPLDVDAGDTVQVRASLENVGTYADVPVSVTVFIRDSNAITVHQETVSAVLTSARKTLRFSNNWIAAPGNYTMDVCITSSGLYEVYEPGRCVTTDISVGGAARWADSAILTASAADGETLWIPGATTTVTWQWSGETLPISGRMVHTGTFEEILLFAATSTPGANSITVTIPQVAPGEYAVEICNDAEAADIEQPTFVCGELPGTVTVPSLEANLIANGDFAGGKLDWASWGTNIQLASDADAAHGNVAKITLASGMRRLLGQGPVAITEANRYAAIASLRAEQVVGGYGHVEFEWKNAKGYVVRVDTIGNAKGTSGWTTASAVMTAPAGAEKVRVQVIAEKGAGAVYFDNVVLTPLD